MWVSSWPSVLCFKFRGLSPRITTTVSFVQKFVCACVLLVQHFLLPGFTPEVGRGEDYWSSVSFFLGPPSPKSWLVPVLSFYPTARSLRCASAEPKSRVELKQYIYCLNGLKCSWIVCWKDVPYSPLEKRAGVLSCQHCAGEFSTHVCFFPLYSLLLQVTG